MFKSLSINIEQLTETLQIPQEEVWQLLIHKAQVDSYMLFAGLLVLAICVATMITVSYECFGTTYGEVLRMFTIVITIVFIFLLVSGIPRIIDGIFTPQIYIVKYLLK